jgi:transcriptional regulator with XRE-family HTH domain
MDVMANPPKSGKRSRNLVDVEVGRRIRARRIERGMSQTALADGLGLTFQQVQKYEKGTNRVGAGRLHQIASLLDVPISFFFDIPDQALNGVTPEKSELFQHLQSKDAVRMLKALSEIEDTRIKHLLTNLTELIAAQQK